MAAVETDESYYEEVTEYYEEEVIDETVYEEIEEDEEDYDDANQGGGMAAMIAAAASRRQNRVKSGDRRITPVSEPITASYNDGDDDDEAAPAGGMAAMIAAAANQRKTRLDKGGEKKMTAVEEKPEEKMDMAQMIAKKANARNERIEAGGAVKVREVPKAHKSVFVDVALEAARVGTLTRLDEHTVVAVAKGKVVEEWKGPSGLRTDHLRSNFFIAVNEAAAKGAMRLQKPVEVTNYDVNAYHEEEEPEDIDKMTDEEGRRVVRQLYLIDRMVEEERKYKKDMWSAENATNVVQYSNMESVALPSAKPPSWKPKTTNMTQGQLMDALSREVAERAWERNYRLSRPKANLQMQRNVRTKYDLNPSPYQTHKYKQMTDKGQKKTDGPLLNEKEEEKKIAGQHKAIVKSTPNVKPGEWSESSNATTPFIPVPAPVIPKKKAPEPLPPPPEPEPEPLKNTNGKTVILLEETTTWSHKRERTKKPKKKKKESSSKTGPSSSNSSKKKTKKGGEGGCIIM